MQHVTLVINAYELQYSNTLGEERRQIAKSISHSMFMFNRRAQ